MTLKDLLKFEGTLAGLDKNKVYFMKCKRGIPKEVLLEIKKSFKKVKIEVIIVHGMKNLNDIMIAEPGKREKI